LIRLDSQPLTLVTIFSASLRAALPC